MGKQKVFVCNKMNRQLSQNLYMSLDTRVSNLNNNVLVVGGTRSGKTFRFVKPQLLAMGTSFVVTDPKGEILRDCGGFLRKHGYRVTVLNLLNAETMKTSNHYNPFRYIRTGIDIEKLIQNMITNTTDKNATASDPFWKDAETTLWQALFYYVWEHEPADRKNIPRVLELLSKADFETDAHGNKKKSELDRMFDLLEMEEGERIQKERREGRKEKPMDPAVVAYNQCMRGAADTVRTIIQCANARLTRLKSPEILDLLRDDEMDIQEIGCGRDYDGKTKTALFCVIPDNDKTFNFIVGMLYSQIFQELYFQADFRYGGKLPVHVTLILDEFYNVALPDDYCSLLSTMGGREISSVIIIQNMAQIQERFEKIWQAIPGNCCTLVYLGGNENESHKYLSEELGDGTIRKYSNGVTTGRNGSGSRNYDEVGRKLMLPDEVRRVDGTKCIVLIQGFQPVLDDKIRTAEHPLFYEMDGTYVHDPERDRQIRDSRVFIHPAKLKHMEQEEASSGKEPVIFHIEDLLSIPEEKILAWEKMDMPLQSAITFANERRQRENLVRLQEAEQRNRLWEPDLTGLSKEQVITYVRLEKEGYRKACLQAMLPLIGAGMSAEDLTGLFQPETDPEEIESFAELYLQYNKNKEEQEYENQNGKRQ